MNVLEFENTQGITLRYSTATVFDRSMAFLIDVCLLGLAVGILSLIFAGQSEVVRTLVASLPILFYSLLMEMLNDGKSVGKMALGLKVVRVDGRYPTGYDYFMRWIFRWIDIYMTSGTLAALLVSSSPRNQRVGDMLGDTTVIRTRNLRIPLSRILKLAKLSTYVPKYPEVTVLTESQVVLIKESLDYKSQYQKENYNKLLEDLSLRISQSLQISNTDSPQVFLQTIIKDYIALTR